MSAEQLIVDDEYFKEQLTRYYLKMGEDIIDKMIESYIEKMQEVKNTAIMEGEIADALQKFIDSAQKLKGCSGEIGRGLRELAEYFIEDIDDADDILF